MNCINTAESVFWKPCNKQQNGLLKNHILADYLNALSFKTPTNKNMFYYKNDFSEESEISEA